MLIDPALAAVLLALGVAVAIALIESGRGRLEARRARSFCATCGRRIVRGLRTCGCDF